MYLQIKRQKLRVRCEEEANELYGLEAEDVEQSRVQELNFEISKIKRDIEKVLAGGRVKSSVCGSGSSTYARGTYLRVTADGKR